MWSRGWVLAWLAGPLALGCGGPICAAPELEAALRDAPAGSTVSVGACRIEGRFTVARGVTLEGQGSLQSTIAGPGTVLVVEGDGASIEGLRIEHGSGHGVVAIDAAALTLRDVAVHSPTVGRAAVGLVRVGDVVLEDVTITGPVTAANATEVPAMPDETNTALYGLLLVDVSARLERVTVSGFALAGAAWANSDVAWVDGSASTNLGLGVWMNGGTAHLGRVAITDTLRGFRGDPTFGLAVGSDTALTTVDVELARAQGGFGMFQDGGGSMHTNLEASENAAGGILVQRTTEFTLTGADVHDNDFAGVLAIEAGGLVVDTSAITATRLVSRVISGFEPIEIGDGIQLVRPTSGTVVRATTLTGNERAGLLLDLGGGDTSTVSIETVGVDAAGAAFGAVAQNGTVAPGWDAGITRSGAAAANDAAFAGGLAVTGIVAPTDLTASGLEGIVAPTD